MYNIFCESISYAYCLDYRTCLHNVIYILYMCMAIMKPFGMIVFNEIIIYLQIHYYKTHFCNGQTVVVQTTSSNAPISVRNDFQLTSTGSIIYQICNISIYWLELGSSYVKCDMIYRCRVIICGVLLKIRSGKQLKAKKGS